MVIMCGHLDNYGVCDNGGKPCRFVHKENCKMYLPKDPHNLREVEKCCGNCRYGGHGYDGESPCAKYGGCNGWDDVCDDWEPEDD